jgi:hypothetical protein
MIGWGGNFQVTGRADHPWSAAVERGRSTLPKISGDAATRNLERHSRLDFCT